MKTQIVYPQSEALITKERAIAEAQPQAATRLLFVDNIRIFLTVLVMLHHLMNIYAGSGGWIYHEGRQDLITGVLGKWFTAVNQSYFMGLFLLIAAYFVPGSCDQKGVAGFLKDRLIRLGIPLAAYSWIIRPLLLYAGLSSYGDLSLSFVEWYSQQYFREYSLIGGGPLWFISALLLFSVVYAIVRLLMSSRSAKPAVETSFPGNGAIAVFAVMIALASFIVRLWFPSDWVYSPLAFQFADFPQYIALFIVGLVAYRQNWLVRLPERTGRVWLAIAAILILLYPPIAILGGAIADATPFLGGWHWQALLAALWQSLLGLAMCVSVIYLFQHRLDRQVALGRFMSRNAYTAYLIHEPVITFAALVAMGLMLYPLLKFGLMALITVPLIFGMSSLIRRLPYTQRVL
ncbi:MAG TPA: acyltransferase family protein [Anaerolineales bacterium]|nr:acyltransferase family protein [Anaerolineales bacterium]